MKNTIPAGLCAIMLLCSTFKGFPIGNQDLNRRTPDSTAFDFWIGKWEATWDEKGRPCHGMNIISRVMGGKVIHESFSIREGANKGFKGESFSVLDKGDGMWKQTWVDSEGSYLDFTGVIRKDTLIFERAFKNKAGIPVYQRMQFYNIEKNRFTWDWESSPDKISWKLLWRINYTRME